jgi:uncharacterized cupredoxin-like copper-binding protein
MARFRKAGALLAASLALAFVAAACSSDDGGDGGTTTSVSNSASPTTDTSTGTPVAATVKDFAIVVDPGSVSAGEIRFTITNDGPSTHEFVVLRTDLAADALPVEGDEVPEDDPALSNAGEAEDIAAGSTTTLALTLEAGSYVILCNITGHYVAGMHTAFTVG